MFNSFPRPIPDGGGTAIKGVVKEYQVYAGEKISVGDFVHFILNRNATFNENNTTYIAVAALDAETAMVAYQDGGNSNYGTAVILKILGSNITVGAPYVFNSGSTIFVSISKLTSAKALIVYKNTSNSSYGTSKVLSISGTTISAGSAVVFESATTDIISVLTLLETKAIVAYRDGGNSGYGTAIILTISGTTITAGSVHVFNNAGDTYDISLAKLSDTNVVVAYRHSSQGTASILTVSGTTISHGSPHVFSSDSTNYISVSSLTATKVIAAYRNTAGTYVRILSVSETTISHGTELKLSDSLSNYINSVAVDDSHALVVYADVYNGQRGAINYLTILNTDVFSGLRISFNNANSGYNSIDKFDTNRFILCFNDAGNFSYGTSLIVETDTNGLVIKTEPATSCTQINGVAKTGGTETIKVYTTEDAP